MKVIDLTHKELQKRLSSSGLGLKIGKYNIVATSKLNGIISHISSLYQSYKLSDRDEFADFYIDFSSPSRLRAYFRPQVDFSFDGATPFLPLPLAQAAAMFEWGLNWCIANNSNQYLIIHAAVIEKNGIGVVLPGQSGNGKSTLCAALVCNGWRLLSDEMALIDTVTGLLNPVPRPVSLKNRSIEVIGAYFPAAYIGKAVNDTAKGTIAHMRPPADSVNNSSEVPPLKLIFPKYADNGLAVELSSVPKGLAFIQLARNAFNYNILGKTGFTAATKLVEQCDCHELKYHSLPEALSAFDELIAKYP